MIGTIQELTLSGGGKPKAKIDGRYYFIETHQGLAVGKRIDFTSGSFQAHGKSFNTVQKFAILPESQQAPVDAQPQRVAAPLLQQPIAAPAASPTPQSQEFTFTEPELRFVSNVVGQAIYGGQIKEPFQIEAWFNAAKAMILGEPMPAVHVKVDTRKANEQATRILEAIKAGNDNLLIEVWQECTHLVTSEDFEAAVWAQLPVPVRNRIKDILDEPKF